MLRRGRGSWTRAKWTTYQVRRQTVEVNAFVLVLGVSTYDPKKQHLLIGLTLFLATLPRIFLIYRWLYNNANVLIILSLQQP